MPEFPNLQEAVRAIATNDRAYSKRVCSAETICPGYIYNRSNWEWGQCGMARESLCTTLTLYTELSRRTAMLEASGTPKVVGGKKLHMPPEFFREDNSPELLFLRHWRELIGDRVIVCAYGGGTLFNGQPFKDHCWTQIVPLGRVGDPKAGWIAETTLTQFSTQVPRVIIQEAAATDGPAWYSPETLHVFGQHDNTSLRTRERFDKFRAEWRMDPFRIWHVGPIDILAGYRLAA